MGAKIQFGGIDATDALGKFYGRASGIEGDDAAGAVGVQFPVLARGWIGGYNLPAGTTVLDRSYLGLLLIAVNTGATVCTLGTLASMGLTSGYAPPTSRQFIPTFKFAIWGAGTLNINPATGVDIIWNGLNPAGFSKDPADTISPTNLYSQDLTLRYAGINPDNSHEIWVAT